MTSRSKKKFFNNIKFDAVIGNPPWVSFSGRQAHRPDEKKLTILSKHFESLKGWPNTASMFLELGMKLLNKNGRIGMVAPLSISHQQKYAPTRKLLEKELHLEEIVNYGEKSFKGVTEPAAVYIFQKKSKQKKQKIKDKAGVKTEEVPSNVISLAEWKKAV